MDTQQLTEHQKNALFTLFLLFLVFVGWNINSALMRSGTEIVQLTKTPFDSSVTLEGKELHSESLRLPPGVYTLNVERDGFYSKEVVVTVAGGSTETAGLYLLPKTDEAYDLVENDEEYAYPHGVGSADVIDPILGLLPIRSLLYSIETDKEAAAGENPITITVTASSSYRAGAINKLRSLGVDISNYRYVFTSYENLFQ